MAEKFKVIGGPTNFWLYSETEGYDITHPPTPNAPKIYPRITLQTQESRVVIDPTKTALVIVDLQNYFLSPALRRPAKSLGLQVVEKLKTVIPACRNAGIRILWLGWGLTQDDVHGMPPTIIRGFSLDEKFEGEHKLPELGVDIGPVHLDDGSTIEGRKVLVRGEWNAEIYTPLAQQAKLDDLRAWKNRLSGFWNNDTVVGKQLQSQGIRTLIFAGCNTDQCVATSLMDAAWRNWDCLLLSDGTATTSPNFAQESVEYNMQGWGFLLTCKALVDGVKGIEKESKSRHPN